MPNVVNRLGSLMRSPLSIQLGFVAPESVLHRTSHPQKCRAATAVMEEVDLLGGVLPEVIQFFRTVAITNVLQVSLEQIALCHELRAIILGTADGPVAR